VTYLLDANAFMEAARLYYAFDIAPGFWSWFAAAATHDDVASVDAVKDEITEGTGHLVTWARALPASFWLTDTDDVVAAMADLATWATTSKVHSYRQEAIDEFLDSADFRLIAQAMATGATVVTRERPAPQSLKKIKIPDVCVGFGVAWADPFTAFRALGLRLTDGTA
jgi:hypothetical protein